MEYKFKKENYNFWLERLKKNEEKQVCTNDILLDEIESEQILKNLKNNCKVLEVGCGHGLLYKQIKNKYNNVSYTGFDFVDELINHINQSKIDETDTFLSLDMTEINKETFDKKFDFIISKRAVQNVLEEEYQLSIIDNLGYNLEDNGVMALVESSSNAQKNINEIRKKNNLDIIKPPFHNLFFDDEKIKMHDFKNIELVKIDPFASDFYYITRLIYALYSKNFLNEIPSFDHPLQKVARQLGSNKFTKKFSQIQTYYFKKKL